VGQKITTTDAPSATFSLEGVGTFRRGYKFPGALIKREEQIEILSLNTCRSLSLQVSSRSSVRRSIG